MNKRSLFLTACCIALYAGVCMAQDFAGGSGTETDPYLIKTPQQLSNLRNYLDEYPKKYFKLGNDLDVSAFCQESWGTAGWEPVGRERTPFGGQLDGDGHKISGLWIDRETEDNIGLFGSISGTVKNLGIATDDTRGGIKGRSYVGSLAGQNSGEIVNCHAAALINGNGGDYGDYSGGLIGYVSGNGSVTNCYASGDVSASDSYSYAGGLIGSVHEGSITNCYASGNVSSLYCSGGLIGHVSEGNTTNCYATGVYLLLILLIMLLIPAD
ncbi:MAG: hypothetical protein LBQ65_08780 [Tannerellaceae bacterium]|jgi:hypothetical protein|nr:hypothetical protein [Tannerellaceae bacterium]